MFEKFKKKTKEEKKEVIKTTGKITLGLAGVGALSFILGKAFGFKDGIEWFWAKGAEMNKQNEDDEEEIDDKEEEGA